MAPGPGVVCVGVPASFDKGATGQKPYSDTQTCTQAQQDTTINRHACVVVYHKMKTVK